MINMSTRIPSAILLATTLYIPSVSLSGQQVIELEVEDVSCPVCVRNTERALVELDGVQQVEVDLDSKRARIVMKPGQQADLDQIRKAVSDAGFTPGQADMEGGGKP